MFYFLKYKFNEFKRTPQDLGICQCKKTHDLISLDRWFDYFGAKNCTLLTLLIAESKPEEMEIMKQIVVSVLNKGENYAIY